MSIRIPVLWLLLALPVAGTQAQESEAAHAAEIAQVHEMAPAEIRALYESGSEYGTFLASAASRRAMWIGNDARETKTEAASRAVESTEASWHLLVIAVDGCSDSANTIPYLADLVSAASNLEMRIIEPAAGQAFMDRFRTPDGRTATPTVVLLDGQFRAVGAWVERPAALQEWYGAVSDSLSGRELLRQKFAWYDEDAGRQTVQEVAAMITEAGKTDDH